MRVTHQMLLNTVLRNLSHNQARLESLQSQLTSGKRLSKLSDDPKDVVRTLVLRASMDLGEQYLRNIGATSSWLNATDGALAGVSDLLVRAQELAVQAANETLSADDRLAMLQEVENLLGSTVQLGNGTYAGNYLFAGAKTKTAPFSVSGGVVTFNDTDPATATKLIEREIAPDTKIVVNVVGHDPGAGTAVFDDIFSALTNFHQSLQTNDTAGIKASLAQLKDAHERLLQERVSVGARINRLEATRDQLTALQTRLAEFRSTIEDADVVEAATLFAQADLVRNAALAAAAKSLPPSLLDYLA